jgi:hypothetical protein
LTTQSAAQNKQDDSGTYGACAEPNHKTTLGTAGVAAEMRLKKVTDTPTKSYKGERDGKMRNK